LLASSNLYLSEHGYDKNSRELHAKMRQRDIHCRAWACELPLDEAQEAKVIDGPGKAA